MTATKTIEHKGRVTVAHKRKSIALAMMAHGESLEMFETMAKRLGNRIDCYCVTVDEDDFETAANIEKAFAHLPGEVHMVPWIDTKYGTGHGDFAANRNRMLNLAREWDKDYVLWLDPDDPPVGKIPDDIDKPVYLFELIVEGQSWYMHHMFRRDVDVKFVQPVHEHLEFGDPDIITSAVLGTIYLERNGSGSYRTGRVERSIEVLLKMIEDNPKDGHAWYYLAQSYRDIGKKAEAAAAFNHRAEMGEPVGENGQAIFWCRFQVAEMTGNPDDYLIAWNERPTRVEPLHRLAAFYNARGQYVVGRMFAQIGCSLPPSEDGMFVERWVEAYGLPSEYAVAAFYLGYRTGDQDLIDRAIKTWEWILNDLDPKIVRAEHRVLFESNLAEAREPGSGYLTTDYEQTFLNSGIQLKEGSICAQAMHFLGELAGSYEGDHPMKVAETGFGVGRSAWAFLEGNPTCTVTSFDLMESDNNTGTHVDQADAIRAAAALIERRFPKRLKLIEGDSKVTVPENQDDWDLVFIDGGHDYETAMADLKNFASPGRTVVMDDTVDNQTWAEGCLRAWNEATDPETGFIHRHLDTRDGPYAWSAGTYK